MIYKKESDMIINTKNTKNYQWGNNCQAWTFIQSENVIVKEELMPPHTEEQLHFHNETEQFFYILDGKASFLLESEKISLSKNDGIKISAKQIHKIGNETSEDLRFLVMSFPGNSNDRVNIQH
jgi:mannose-6-phosphate isomerase-like protein (cupin superfamily)